MLFIFVSPSPPVGTGVKGIKSQIITSLGAFMGKTVPCWSLTLSPGSMCPATSSTNAFVRWMPFM